MDNSRILLVDDDTALLQALPQAIALRMKDTNVDVSDSAQAAFQQSLGDNTGAWSQFESVGIGVFRQPAGHGSGEIF